MNETAPALFVGLMSGTSVDAIDAVLVRFDPAPKLLGRIAHHYPILLQRQILQLGLGNGACSLQEIGTLDVAIGTEFAAAALALLSQSGLAAHSIRAIGSHGQTVWHSPCSEPAYTMQLGDPNVIAERTHIDTVADFRRRDVAAGGQGAPLVPAFHAAFLHCAEEDRAVLNLGGIANLTLLPGSGATRGFDTGPANTLLDLWVERHRGKRYDEDGAFAGSGTPNLGLLGRLLDEAYFAMPAPKSTGRDLFNMNWLDSRLAGFDSISPEDVQATLVALTARSVANSLRKEAPSTRRLLICGGGAHNRILLAAIAAELPKVLIESTSQYGLDADYLEAMAFAWLARETLAHRPGNMPAVTGARGARILGGLYRA